MLGPMVTVLVSGGSGSAAGVALAGTGVAAGTVAVGGVAVGTGVDVGTGGAVVAEVAVGNKLDVGRGAEVGLGGVVPAGTGVGGTIEVPVAPQASIKNPIVIARPQYFVLVFIRPPSKMANHFGIIIAVRPAIQDDPRPDGPPAAAIVGVILSFNTRGGIVDAQQ